VVNNLKDFGIHQLPSEECMFVKYIYPRANSTTSPKQGGCTDDPEWFGDVDDRDIDEHGRLLSNNTDIFGTRIPHKILAILWVDDFVIAYTTGNKDVDKLVAHLKKHFTITVDEFTWFLKCEIIRDRSNRTLYLSQARFAEDCVQSIMGVPFSEVKKTNHTPFVEGYMPNILGCSKSSADVEFMSTRTERFRSHVAKLLWLTRTRQELRFAVSPHVGSWAMRARRIGLIYERLQDILLDRLTKGLNSKHNHDHSTPTVTQIGELMFPPGGQYLAGGFLFWGVPYIQPVNNNDSWQCLPLNQN
jgi:hypothetical protein